MSKTLVIILSETRAHELTFYNFKKNVIDELNADLCLCIGVKADYDYENPFYKLAKYHFLYNEEEDPNFAKSAAYSYEETPNKPVSTEEHPVKHYTDFIKLKAHFGYENIETEDPTQFSNFIISTYIHVFFLWFLQHNMRKTDILSKYDRFLILRSDYIYIMPFPKMEILNGNYIWVPDGEDYSGICDRAVVLSREHFERYVNIMECFYTKPNRYYEMIDCQYNLNMEMLLKMHLEENGISGLVRRYPYISYSVRNINGTTRWGSGLLFNSLGYYVKYPSEYDRSNNNKVNYENSGKDIDQFYRDFCRI
jgi:hypothetical protein